MEKYKRRNKVGYDTLGEELPPYSDVDLLDNEKLL